VEVEVECWGVGGTMLGLRVRVGGEGCWGWLLVAIYTYISFDCGRLWNILPFFYGQSPNTNAFHLSSPLF